MRITEGNGEQRGDVARRLGKMRLILRCSGEQDGNAVVDGKDPGAILPGERSLHGGRDASARAFFRRGPAQGLVGVRAAELGQESFDPGGIGGSSHAGTFASRRGGVKGEGGREERMPTGSEANRWHR